MRMKAGVGMKVCLMPHAIWNVSGWAALQPQGRLLGYLPAPRCNWALPLGPWHNPSGSGPDYFTT